MTKIAPSIASGPLTNLEAIIQQLVDAGASVIHFDIEDGVFVPEINLGAKVIKELRPLTNLPFDVHLMMQDPEWLIPKLANFGANMVSVHYEALRYPRRTLQMISKHGMQAGLAFNPATEIPNLDFCQPYLSFILALSTEPEEEDPAFLPSVLNKIEAGRSVNPRGNLTWVIDGAISADNACQAVKAGADMLVIGRGIFKGGRILENMRGILSRMNNNC